MLWIQICKVPDKVSGARSDWYGLLNYVPGVEQFQEECLPGVEQFLEECLPGVEQFLEERLPGVEQFL